MDALVVESSSSDEDIYVNSVARLKALKKRRIESDDLTTQTPIVASIEAIEVAKNGNTKDILQRETRNISYIGRHINRFINTDRGNTITRTTRRRHPPVDNLECDAQIILDEKEMERSNQVITEFHKDEVIALSSDEEACDEDDNYEINIKVLWRSNRLDRLSMRRYDSFLKIFQHYADLENVPIDEILIMKKDRIISYTDTPVLVKLSIIDILDGGIVNPGMKRDKDVNKDNMKNVCNIKVQTANRKQSLTIPLKRDQQFKALFAKCAEELGMSESSLKLYFDGEQIDPADTPKSLDLEEEACVDLHIIVPHV